MRIDQENGQADEMARISVAAGAPTRTCSSRAQRRSYLALACVPQITQTGHSDQCSTII